MAYSNGQRNTSPDWFIIKISKVKAMSLLYKIVYIFICDGLVLYLLEDWKPVFVYQHLWLFVIHVVANF